MGNIKVNEQLKESVKMIPIDSQIEGKEAVYGDIVEPFRQEGFELGGNWEYDNGYFDSAIVREKHESIFLRLPVEVVDGELDNEDARIKFQQPFLVRHVVEGGVDTEFDPLPLIDQLPLQAFSLVNQFQTPIEKDGDIHDQERRKEKARLAIERIMKYVH
jgi:hypothetical protein